MNSQKNQDEEGSFEGVSRKIKNRVVPALTRCSLF